MEYGPLAGGRGVEVSRERTQSVIDCFLVIHKKPITDLVEGYSLK
uniref:Uncharacterized protein n=1 Tax=Angiostrongylus cantonensis TaxID=6313 RepID=A0A0K0DFL7_ANGCA